MDSDTSVLMSILVVYRDDVNPPLAHHRLDNSVKGLVTVVIATLLLYSHSTAAVLPLQHKPRLFSRRSTVT